jgi:hypothetical protein
MIKAIKLSLPLILLLGCSDSDDIPTSDNRSEVKVRDWSDLQNRKDSKNSDDTDEAFDDSSSDDGITDGDESLASEDRDSDYEDSSVEDEVSSSDDNMEDSYDEGETVELDELQDESSVAENESDNYDVESSDSVVSTISSSESGDDSPYSNYEEKLEVEMAKAIANYPQPPSPANLSPTDSRDDSSFRPPTEKEVSTGSGDFPPVPPAMFLNSN